MKTCCHLYPADGANLTMLGVNSFGVLLGASEVTIAKDLVTLGAALKLAVRAGLWLGNPAASLPVALAPEYRPRERFRTPGELSKLLGALLADQAARVAFIVATSACWGESCRAMRVDVAEGLSTVFIRERRGREGDVREALAVPDGVRQSRKDPRCYCSIEAAPLVGCVPLPRPRAAATSS